MREDGCCCCSFVDGNADGNVDGNFERQVRYGNVVVVVVVANSERHTDRSIDTNLSRCKTKDE